MIHQLNDLKVINNLSELLNELNTSNKENYAAIGANLKIPLDQFLPYVHWNSKFYTRNCIVRTAHYELILLCWEEGQKTSIHCHGGEECWVYLIDGKLQETHYQYENNKITTDKSETLSKGQKSFMSDELGYHKLENIVNRKTMSLHLYMDPIDQCTVFDKNLNSFKQIDLSYYSYNGKLAETLV